VTDFGEFDDSLWQTLFHAVPAGMIAVSGSGRAVFWNKAAENLLEWSPEEIAAGPPPPSFASPEPQSEFETRRRRKDGSIASLQVRVLPWSGGAPGVIFVLTDITAHRAAETAVEDLTARSERERSRVRESARFRELLEAAPDAIIEVDKSGNIVLLNRATEVLFGYGREELLGQPVELLIPHGARVAHRQHRQQYWECPARRPMGGDLILEGLRKDGSLFPVEISLSPVEFEGGFRVSAIIRDVSERRAAEERLRGIQKHHTEELSAKNGELEARNRDIERANRLKDEFLSGMSHELRTPLHTIIGFTELLQEQLEGPLNPKQHRFVDHILRDSQHLLALINDVLDLSKIESGHLDLHREHFAFPEALEEVLSSMRPRAKAKSIAVESVAPDAVVIFADRLRCKQILFNLLNNAVKFTPDGGQVKVEVLSGPDGLTVAVSDTGIGIPIAEQPSVFDKFYQVGQRQAGGQEGTGLGLAITQRLVHEHGGTIALSSEPGRGSCFTFTIPAAAPAPGSQLNSE